VVSFSYWLIKSWFHTEGKLTAVLITLPLGVPNWSINHAPTSFLVPLPGRKRISARGVSHFQFFTLLLFCLVSFSHWSIKPWFHTEGKLTAMLITPSSWGSQLVRQPCASAVGDAGGDAADDMACLNWRAGTGLTANARDVATGNKVELLLSETRGG
jgi:hypothetical protein